MTTIEHHTDDKTAPRKRKPASQAVAVAAPPAEPAPPVSGNMLILKQAMENGATGDDLKNMLDLYERLEDRASRRAFDDAMARVQEDMPLLVKNRLVDYESGKGRVTYKHEDLAMVVDTIKPILHKHGLTHRFRTEQLDAGQIKVTCIITGHGHREETSLASSRDGSGGKNDIQGIGSTVTYLERYTLKAALGLAVAHDDDGRGGAGGGGTITALQLLELEKLIKEVDAKAENVCRAMKPPISTLAEMTAAQFEKAKAKLEAMRVPL